MMEWRSEVKYSSVVTEKGACLHCTFMVSKMVAHLATAVRAEMPL